MIDKIAEELKKGKVVALPTDTVYGLIADATDKKAVEKVFKIKKRKKDKPLPFFINSLEMANDFATMDKKQKRFLKSVWPGKTTIVLNRRKKGKLYGAGKKTIALRIPKNKLILGLIKKIGNPLTATSANISGKFFATSAKEVLKQFQGNKYQPDLIINSGKLKSAKPSKIIDLTGPKIKILRK